MSKLFNWKSLVIILFIVVLFPLLKSGLYQTHDAEANIARFAAYFQAFKDLQIPPRWAGTLNYGYGSPVLIFYYPLPGYLASLIHFLGLSFENTFKIIISISFVGSFFTFYLWSSGFLKKNAALISALVYSLAPYHLLDLFVRGDVAELLALALVPLVLLLIDKTAKKASLSTIALGGILYALLITAHNGISLIFSVVFVLYIFIKAKSYKEILSCCLILLTGLGLSSFFWLPALFESPYVNARLFVGDIYRFNFPSVPSLIYSNWGFGPDVNKIGGLSPQIGIVPFLATIASFLVLIKKKQGKNVVFWFIIFSVIFFMTTSYASFIWNKIYFLKLLEFPWRLTAVSSFAAAVLTGYLCNILSFKKCILLALFFLISIAPFVRVLPTYVAHADNYYLSYNGTTYYHGEASPKWTAGDFGNAPKKLMEIIGGSGKINNIHKLTDKQTFTTFSKDVLQILDNTVYFPGWQVRVDGKKVPIQFQDMNHRGLITFNVPSGKHSVRIEFKETPIRLFSDIISLISLVLVAGVLLLENRVRKCIHK